MMTDIHIYIIVQHLKHMMMENHPAMRPSDYIPNPLKMFQYFAMDGPHQKFNSDPKFEVTPLTFLLL